MNNILVEATERMGKNKIHLKYLEHLYSNIELINDINNLKDANYINISLSSIEDRDIPIILNTLASKLIHDNKIAVKMFKTENQIIIEVQ